MESKILCLTKQLTVFLVFLLVIYCLFLPVTAAEPNLTADTEQQIWQSLLQLTDNPLAAAGIMGNLYYESELDPLALQGADSLPVSKEDYAGLSQQEDGRDFISDGHGFGLAQWTYPDRKLRLLELASSRGCSDGDLRIQLQLLGEELDTYNMLYRISHADSIRFASDYFLENYENPGLQDESVKEKRARKGQYYFDKFTKPVPEDDGLTQAQRDVAQIAAGSEAYGIPAENGYCMAWVTAVYQEAGIPAVASPSALSSASAFSVSTDLRDIPVGAAIYGKKNQKYGHIGLYAGNGLVYHNANGARADSLEAWIQTYDGFCWGWPGGIDLTTLP